MIKLEVEEYCHNNCRAFEAIVEEPASFYTSNSEDGDPVYLPGPTVIRCKNRHLCRQLLNYLKKQTKEVNADGDR